MHPYDRKDPERHSTRRFSLLLADEPQSLARVVTLLMRRGVIIDSLRYGPSRHDGWARLDLECSADEHRGHGLDQRLEALLEVRDLVELSPAADRYPAVTSGVLATA